MATKITKNVISKHFLSSFKMLKSALRVEYIVEAKLKRNWKRVGGPFPDETAANDLAHQYSGAHPNIDVQVVVLQSSR